MADAEQEYDTHAAAYRESKKLRFREHIEAYTLFRLLGPLQGEKVLDLACGEGFYTRRIKRAGAGTVMGIDISRGMIALAEEEEARAPLGVCYRHADAGNVDFAAAYDVVSAAYLLCYARTAAELARFCRIAFQALKPGGRFLGFNDNINEDPSLAPSFARYGFEKRCAHPLQEGDEIVYTIQQTVGGIFEITNYYLSPATYAEAFARAGFVGFKWEGPWLDPESSDDGFWTAFMQRPPMIGFSAIKPAHFA